MNNLFNFFKNKKVLLTGHTGFKGSWLCNILHLLSAKICGISREELSPSHFESLQNSSIIEHNLIDILNYSELERKILKFNPDIIIHFAAQSIVRLSYKKPIETISSNVLGTANILNIGKKIKKKPFVAIITSDKCYENKEINLSYLENDRMGGHDIYSASKGAAELIISSFARSFYIPNKQKLISLRAGNVIGGGDWGKDRLFTDLVNALLNNENPLLRNPQSSRPWQYILDVLSGYLSAIIHHYNDEQVYFDTFNIGPYESNIVKVINVAKIAVESWDSGYKINISKNSDLHEAKLLSLNINKALKLLKWRPQLDIYTSVNKTIDWYKKWKDNHNMKNYTNKQIEEYFNNFNIN